MSASPPVIVLHSNIATDKGLADLRADALGPMREQSPNLADDRHRWADAEQALRAKGITERSKEHLMGFPLDAPDWPNEEIARALIYTSTVVHTECDDPYIGHMWDKLQIFFVGIAAERLGAKVI